MKTPERFVQVWEFSDINYQREFRRNLRKMLNTKYWKKSNPNLMERKTDTGLMFILNYDLNIDINNKTTI